MKITKYDLMLKFIIIFVKNTIFVNFHTTFFFSYF